MSWDLRDSTAHWHGSHWSVDVALAHESGRPLIQIHYASQRPVLSGPVLSGPVLSVGITPSESDGVHSAAGLQFGDAYVRQKDLIAIFPELAPGRFGYQIDIRLLDEAPPKAVAMEIWLSIQTSFLDSHPQLELQIKGERFKALVENCWASESCRLGVMVHPLDQQDCHIMPEKDGLAMRVFGRFMEKGVIRRMRFRLIVAMEPESISDWRERFEEFSNSPLPLNT